MIFRPRSRRVIALTWVAVAASVRAPADVVWTGLGVNSNWTTPANWEGNVIPFNDGTDQIFFGSALRTGVLVNTPQVVRRIRFDFSSGGNRSYSLSGAPSASLTLGADGIEVIAGSSSGTGQTVSQTASILSRSPGGVASFDSSLALVLGASQVWRVGADAGLQVAGPVSGGGQLTLAGNGAVRMSGNNSYTAGTVLESGQLEIEHNAALGTGALTVTGPATLYSSSGGRTLANVLNLTSSLLDFVSYGGDFRFTGPVTLAASTTLRNLGQPVYFSGAIAESGGARTLTISGLGAVVLSGANTYSGGSVVQSGGLFFSNAMAVPPTGALSTSAQGYIGTGFSSGVQSGFITKFSVANTLGTIGFDTAPGATNTAIFAEPVDLSAFNPFARLGSATRATLSSTAVITPATAGGYRFGGGGGTLKIESKLTGPHGLTVDSSSTGIPLTLLLTNSSNDYTGLTTVTDSALVFADGGISSGSASASFILGSGGYIGSADPNFPLSAWLGKFSRATTTGVIGLDSADVSNPRTISGTLDLSPFLSGTSIALGTSSAAILAGSINLPPSQSNYLLTGYKGGWLTVETALAGPQGLQIGHALGDYPEFDPNDLSRMSTVFLKGSNSHSGGTMLFSGRLVLGHASALGSSALTVDGSGANVLPRLETSINTNPTFTNQLVVRDDFEIGGVNNFAWSGNIVSGVTTGVIQKYGASSLTLSGSNPAFSGGFQINEGTITFGSDTAAGSGKLDLGLGSGVAAFTTAAPTLNGLAGGTSTASVMLAPGTLLTINQVSDSIFRGQIQGAGGIAKTGAGTLRLEASGSFAGGTAITAGTLHVASSGALGSNTVALDGTTSNLKLEPGVTLANAIAFGPTGGRLSGQGSFSSAVVLGPNSVIAPGSSVGTLAFTSGLTLAPGGSYDFEMQDALAGPGVGWDFVQVTGPLSFAEVPTLPFTLNLISLNSSGASGNPANFSSANAYSWSIVSATSFVHFNPAAVSIDTTNFTSTLNGGSFSLSTSGSNMVLNFTPVPEPSTWALLLAGLGLAGLRKLRRRS